VPLNGKRVLVTGGSRGLGLLLARDLAKAGSRVAICARDQEELDWARNYIAEQSDESPLTLVCDVSSRADVERMHAHITQAMGGLDILVNNAGIIDVGRYEAMDLEDFETAMATMFWGPVYTTMAFLPEMKARDEGHIVNITSIGGKVSVPHLLPYSSAKFAATGFSEGLRTELAGTGVAVTTVVPGLMRTGSFVNAETKGKPEAEAAWFGLSASLPFISSDADKAAARIVRAIERQETELVLTMLANVAARINGVAPGVTSQVLSGAERLISAIPAKEGPAEPGLEASAPLWKAPLSAFSALGRQAVRKFQPMPEEELRRREQEPADAPAA
jgi:short-subunit dehydrogenase